MSNTKQQVMAAVGTIYIARMFAGPVALKLYALVLSVWGISKLVWVSKVVENLLAVEKGGIASISNFFVAAISHAHLGVQAFLLVALVAAVLLAVDLVRSSAGGARLAA